MPWLGLSQVVTGLGLGLGVRVRVWIEVFLASFWCLFIYIYSSVW